MNRPPGGGLPAHSAARPAPHALAIVVVLVAFISAAVAAPVWTPSATAASGSPAATLIPSSGAVPVTIDTDIFSDVDDVGALATAFGLQLKGEARVVAIGVNSRTSRPAVATNSWKCAAALAQFYGFPATPIGTDTPNNGTEVNAPDFIGPCSTLASASTPVPGTAVAVYRQALSGQADGSVVMIGTGYFENLSTLLNSPGDAISPLSGRALIAQKVKSLVVMGGGFPSRAGETNLNGNPGAAADVAAHWPTKLVWSGYEVGDAIHTGNTISALHPANSPVRVSYEAFVGANNWVYSYDLTAVYHALRPTDPVLSEVGPGTNVVNADGSNVFTTGTGNQYYLRLADAGSLDVSIESLLDKLPPSGPDSTSPVITDVGTTGLPTGAVSISWTTDEPSNTQVEYGTTPVYDVTTPLAALPVIAHVQVVAGLVAGTTYHFRVKSVDPSSNSAASPDFTFVAPAAFSSDPADTFDSNAISPSKWTTQQVGSTVVAANQQLGIAHPGGGWTQATLASATPYDQTNKAVQVQVKRAANDGLAGQTVSGDTWLFLSRDENRYAMFLIADGSLTAWVNDGSGEVKVSSGWPAYKPTDMQWLRFREQGGTLRWEYAGGTTAPGSWSVLASMADPFSMTSVRLRITSGSNAAGLDTATFDNVATVASTK